MNGNTLASVPTQEDIRKKLALAVEMVRAGSTWDQAQDSVQIMSPKKKVLLTGSGLASMVRRISPTEFPRQKRDYTRQDRIRVAKNRSSHVSAADRDLFESIAKVMSVELFTESERIRFVRLLLREEK